MNSSKTIAVPAVDNPPGSQRIFGRWFIFLSRHCLAIASKTTASRVRLGLGMLFIFASVFIVYSPILPGNFVIDDHRLIKEDNPLVNGQLGPLNIWFQTDFTLSTFTLWLQWLAWGENPAGYHVVNIMLQGLSAVLFWRLLVRLKIPGAWVVALIFAVHPVCVNSVARIAEIKNTLSLPFFILSFWSYLRYEELSLKSASQRRMVNHHWRDPAALWYGLSLVAFVLALLSKTSTVMLPVVLLGCAAWQRGRITRQDLLQTSPYFLLSLGFGLMSVWFQKHGALVSVGATLPPESFLEQLAVAGRVIWFYLGKALLPINLSFIYERWKLDATAFTSFVSIFLLLGGFALCWRFRQKWGRHMLFGLGCFIVTLFPALGFFDSQFLTVWQVSDHLQYLSLIAPLTLIIAGLACLINARIFRCAAVILIFTLSVLTFHRARVFATEESLFQDTLAKNPTASAAYTGLGIVLLNKQNHAGAAALFLRAIQLNPKDGGTYSNLGQALALQEKFTEAEPYFLTAIKLKPDDSLVHKQYANALVRQGRNPDAIVQLQVSLCLNLKPDIQSRMDLAGLLRQAGRVRPAVDQLHKVLLSNPDLPEAQNNLAWLLATCSDETVRDGTEAVRHAERACRLTAFKRTEMISTLAAAYAEAGRFPEAVITAEGAVKLQTANGETRFAAINNQLLPLYRADLPYHEKPASE